MKYHLIIGFGKWSKKNLDYLKNKKKLKNIIIKTRDKLADAVTESTTASMNSTGINPVRQSGRYVKVNVKIPSGGAWKDAQGIDLVASKSGLR